MMAAASIAAQAQIASSGTSGISGASLRFFGSPTADLFSREIEASFAGALEKDYVPVATAAEPAGFINASPQGQGWYGTMWTRDGGTFLRELTMRGEFEQASLLARCLMQMVEKNDAGYYFYPRYFRGNTKGSGTELDGTSSIVIGLVLLWERLPATDPLRHEIQSFLLEDASPVAYVRVLLSKAPLLPGSGEFGCGMQVQGECDNVVQNNLVRLALEAVSRMESALGDRKASVRDHELAVTLRRSMDRYLVAADGAWIWAIDASTLAPDPKVLNARTNLGFGGTNGVLAMTADVLGLQPASQDPGLAAHSRQTFLDLYEEPRRKEQFDRFGIWTQFDVLEGGVLTSASYGQGYALQDMLLTDDLSMADKAMTWLANATYQPGYDLKRSSPYFFYERYYSPEAPGKVVLGAGCGALNLVNVSEPLKVSRLILGVDDSNPAYTAILPRLLPDWKRMEAHDWPILTDHGVVRADIVLERADSRATLRVTVLNRAKLTHLRVRLPSDRGWVWRQQDHVSRAVFSSN